MQRILFIMIDGFGDVNVPIDMNNRVSTDFFSNIKTKTISKHFLNSKDGFYGIMDPVEPGIACGSDTAHLSMFGFNPLRFYTGRGAFETIGAGLAMYPGEIGFKCNFACIDTDSKRVLFRKVDKDFANEAIELCDYLQFELNKPGTWLKSEGIAVTIKHATEHRCGVKISKVGTFLSDQITGTDPLYDNLPLMRCESLNHDDIDAVITAEIVEKVSNEITDLLLKHPLNLERRKNGKNIANYILFRGCSKAPSLLNFDLFNGVSWNPSMMARTCIISGIGQGLGFTIVTNKKNGHQEESKSTITDDLNYFLDSIRDNPSCQFGFFHIKVVDEVSHGQDYYSKVDLIEFIDSILQSTIGKIEKDLNNDKFRIVLTGDHSTLCRIGEHSCEPVPFLVSERLPPTDSIEVPQNSKILSDCFFDNNIGRFSGRSIVEFLTNIMNQ